VNGLVNWLSDNTDLGRPAATVIVIAGLFLVAIVLSKLGARVAARMVDRGERRARASGTDPARISSLRQRETAISLASTSIRYVLFALAVVLSLATLAGAQRLQTIIGASFLAVIIGFAAQRFLMDIIAGLLMFFEGWFRIGDAVAVDALKVQGVVEAVSLRTLVVRGITGEVFFVPNSQVNALRLIPRGYHEAEVEFFTTELEPGRELVAEVARIVPGGTTRFVRRPKLAESERLDDHLFRITARCAVAVGREWLADSLLPSLIKERAPEGLLVFGPIVTFHDEAAVASFSRAIFTDTGRPARRAPLGRRPPTRPPPERARDGGGS
jgi:hypothetical protein